MMLTQTPPDPKTIQSYALRLLARREHSRLELRRKLLLKNFPADLIASTLDTLAAQGWQDDLRFAHMYARVRIAQGDGILKLQAKLQHCGLSEEIITQVLPTDTAFWQEQIQRKWHRKCQFSTTDFARRARDIRFLQSRGFTLEHIRAVLA
jgi:regulatory protein